MPDIYFFVKDRSGCFVDANRGFLEMLGVSRKEDIIGKTDYHYSPRELAEKFVADDSAVMSTETPIENRVELVPNGDGSISWHITTKVPLYDSEGKVAGLAGFTRDLRKAASTVKRYGIMTQVLEYIESHYAEPIRVSFLAASVHLSVSQFERRFKTLFQSTPLQYLNKVRITKACRRLLETDDKITKIASLCGFYDHSHFIRQFIRVTGVSPQRYRKEHL